MTTRTLTTITDVTALPDIPAVRVARILFVYDDNEARQLAADALIESGDIERIDQVEHAQLTMPALRDVIAELQALKDSGHLPGYTLYLAKSTAAVHMMRMAE